MRFLQVHVGAERFLLGTDEVTEVLPLIQWKQVLHAPLGVIGLINYRGVALPLVDLAKVAVGRAAAARRGSRIVMVRDARAGAGAQGHFGLLVEHVAGLVDHEASAFRAADPLVDVAPLFGMVLPDAAGVLQRLEPQALMAPMTSWLSQAQVAA